MGEPPIVGAPPLFSADLPPVAALVFPPIPLGPVSAELSLLLQPNITLTPHEARMSFQKFELQDETLSNALGERAMYEAVSTPITSHWRIENMTTNSCFRHPHTFLLPAAKIWSRVSRDRTYTSLVPTTRQPEPLVAVV
jgi:hypothetical protein